VARVDLHIHSRFSDRPPEWLLRRLRIPDAWPEPLALYEALRGAGMDYVTITDHNRIEGCLSIADRPGVIIGEQVTARFPEDRVEVGVLVWGLNEAQHREIAALRESVYDLQRYLAGEGLAHAVAHPLFDNDRKIGAWHFERLILLFRHFEVLNGHRAAMFGATAAHVLSGLTPERVAAFAERHGLEPTHPEAWNKVFVGGSDDHAGLFPGRAFTVTPRCRSAEEFLGFIREGRCVPEGVGGSPLAISHALYQSLQRFAEEKIPKLRGASSGLVGKAFERFMEGRDPTRFTWGEKLNFLGQGILTGRIFELAKPAHASLWGQMAAWFAESDFRGRLARETAGVAEPERRAFIIANLFGNQVAYRFFSQFLKEVTAGNLVESIQQFSTLLTVLLPLAPYYYAFQSQAPSQRRLREICDRAGGGAPPFLQNRKRAWFTDTLDDVNGVATTIRKITGASVAAGRDLVVVTSRAPFDAGGLPLRNFPPVGEFALPEYELQTLSFPPVLEMLDWIQREGFNELIISTPGPVGLVALLGAKLFGIRAVGIYHTDFPQYVRILTDDGILETLTWNFMHWFYSQLDLVYVNSAGYRDKWVERGIPASRIAILPRGLDLRLFDAARRDDAVRRRWGVGPSETVALYVGRISKEKDLDVLVAAARQVAAAGVRLRLVFVGDGPYLKELKASTPEAVFTGYLKGEALAGAFASADFFAFPSTTDTFGNVILEAMASGLPCVVSDAGGPRELVVDGATGFVTRALDAGDFARGLKALASDPGLRSAMSAAALKSVEGRDWAEAARRFWEGSPE
jgi:glycosyltransferase involved in cell wall biosynthesis